MVQRKTGRADEGQSDAQLLGRFAATRDATAELAFRALVERHGPMVLSVCRQILRHTHDADDAFQATFLVLVRKAGSIRTGDSLAPWLYSVAYRTAHRARAVAARYRPGIDDQIPDMGAAPDEAYKLDLRPLLYQELDRLPDKYRDPIVLCHLEGKTHQEAAQLLHWPVGTVSGRLSRGRQLLRDRLERRGVVVPSALFSMGWMIGLPSLSTSSLAAATVSAATRLASAQTVSASTLSLAQGVLRTMLLRKLGTIAAAVILIGTVTGGAGVWAHWSLAPERHRGQPADPAAAATKNPTVAPVPSTSPAPRSQPSQRSGSQSLMADNGSSECPLSGDDDDRPYCPISMAAHALKGMVGQLHNWAVSSH
jgi:RNA polymerase sigma factor (sigma-70 family)